MRRDGGALARRTAIVVAVVALGALALPALLLAHGALKRSDPAAGARLGTPMSRVTLEFNEAVETQFVRVTARDSAGRAVAAPTLRFSEDRKTVIAEDEGFAALRSAVIVSWRIAGADGHPVEGTVAFRVEAPEPVVDSAAPPAVTGADGIGGTTGDWARVDGPAATLLRLLQFVAVLALVGAWSAQALVLPRAAQGGGAHALPESLSHRTGQLARVAAITALVVLLGRLVAQTSALGASGAGGYGELISGTMWGRGWFAAAVGAVLAAALGHRGARAPGAPGIAIAVMLLGTAAMGHAAAAPAPLAAILTDVAHQLGAGIWIGTLFWLAAIALPLTVGDANARALIVHSFSTTALAGAALLALSGAWNAWRYLGSPAAALSSAYGRVLGVKLAVLAAVALTGLYNWRRVLPRIQREDAMRRLRATSFVELIIALAVLAVTARLVVTPAPLLMGP